VPDVWDFPLSNVLKQAIRVLFPAACPPLVCACAAWSSRRSGASKVMIELIQFPWSPYCLVQNRILGFSGVPHKIINRPPSDRSLIWRLTRQRYYQVPVVKDGRNVLFETDENSQVIAKYLDARLGLGLFPKQWDGLQRIVWRYIENEVEGQTFRLNDAHYREFVPPKEQLPYIRHKERKFGRGCLDQWRLNQKQLIGELTALLVPFEQMLAARPFLLEDQPRFIDFDLWGILANFLYSGHYRLPVLHPKIGVWYKRMSTIKFNSADR
jgi:glutathione S-transferase